MKLHALMNRLGDIGEDREVIVRVEGEHISDDTNGFSYDTSAREYDVVGAEPDKLAPNAEGATVVLLLRERAPQPETFAP